MWRVLLDLLAAARRPLVFVDFETAGLGGKPPVEFACLVYAPWDSASDDAETRAAARHCPPGLSYAVKQRLDPGMPIDWGATKVHGIRDADVRGLPRYDAEDFRGFFQGYALGDAADGVGPAIWCGHNVQEADLPWGRRWGYFPDDDADAIDTFRLRRRLAKEHPRPLALDVVEALGVCNILCADLGLDAFAGTLTGLHAALCGERHDAHGAMADCEAAARSLCRMLDGWSPLWPMHRADVPASVNLTALLAALDVPPAGQVSWDGWLREDDSAAPVAAPRGAQRTLAHGPQYAWAKGKYKGQPAHRDAYVLDLPRRPTGHESQTWWCSQHTADIFMGLRPVAVAR